MNILKYVFDKFGCKHEAYDKKDIDDKIKTINDNITTANNNIKNLQSKDTELNTKITNLQNNVYVKGNYAVLEGTSSGTVLQFNYPSGFTNENCILIGYGFVEDDNYLIISNFPTSTRILLGSNKIAVVTPNTVQKVKVLLFKYK